MSRFAPRRPEFLGSLAVPWTPAQAPGFFWGKPIDSRLTLSGNNITSISDNFGSGRTLSNATSAQQPLRVQNGLGSNNTMLFDGSNDFLSNASIGLTGSSSVVIMAVMRFVTGGATEDLPIAISPASNKARLRSFYRAANGTTLGFAGWAVDVSSSTHTLEIGGDHNLLGVWNTQLASPSNVRIMKNGTATTHSTPENLQTTLDGLSIGGVLGSAAYYANISVAEFLIYSSLPSTDILDRCMGYLAWEHNLQAKLPAGFIYKNSPPYL